MSATDHTSRRYLVTGAASGIGAAVAEKLLRAGAEVVSLDRNPPAAAVAQHVKVDLADPGSIDAALAEIDGSFDALLSVAGVPGTLPAEVVFAVNALATRHLAEAMIDRLNPGGAVVAVSSIAGYGWPERIDTIRDLLSTETYEEGAAWFATHPQEGNAYNFSKEVVSVYVQTMGLAFADLGLRINAVLPGPIETPILADFEESMGKDSLDALKELLGRHGSAEEIADAVLFLAGPASRWINGTTLIADGSVSGAVLTGLVPPPEI